MSDSWGKPWSDDPNAPLISSSEYSFEKHYFAGLAMGAMVYGIAIALFFQCIGALINPANTTKKSVKWGLVAHTMALFLSLTTRIALDRYAVSTSYIDNRDFPGTDEFPPGPLGYDAAHFIIVPFIGVYPVMFPLSLWLADGLLLYRCYVIFSMSYRVMVLPCLLYTSSIVVGIMRIYYESLPESSIPPTGVKADVSYFSISVSLNVLLTLMIITKLVLHQRNIRRAIGTSGGTTRLYTTIIMMLVESCALYAIAFISYTVCFALAVPVITVFAELLAGIQAVAPYLIVLRVAERRALTSEMITSGSDNVGSIRFRSQGMTDSDGSLPDHNLTSSTRANAEAPDEVGPRDENGIEEVPL